LPLHKLVPPFEFAWWVNIAVHQSLLMGKYCRVSVVVGGGVVGVVGGVVVVVWWEVTKIINLTI
jgi:hypothetical protein